MLFTATVFGMQDGLETSQAFVEAMASLSTAPTHESIMAASTYAVRELNSNGIPKEMTETTGLTNDELQELGDDYILEALSHLPTDAFLELLQEVMEHHILGADPKPSGTPSLDAILTEERRLTQERLSSALGKAFIAHEGVDRRRCNWACWAGGSAGGLAAVLGIAAGVVSLFG